MSPVPDYEDGNLDNLSSQYPVSQMYDGPGVRTQTYKEELKDSIKTQ